MLGLLSRLLALCFVEQFRLEQAHRSCPIFVLAALVLAFNHDSGGKVRDPDGRISFVDVLPSRTTRTKGVDPKLCFINGDLVDFFDFRHDGYGARRRVNAALRFSLWNALYPMCARLKFEMAIHIAPRNTRNDLFEASVLTLAITQDLDVPPHAFGITEVHFEKVSSKNGGFVTTRARTNL